MVFLPGRCESCAQVSLVPEAECAGGYGVCGSCGARLCVVPGRAYPEGDIPLFQELSSLVQSTSVTGVEAEHLCVALEECLLSEDDLEALELLVFWLPPLSALKPILAANVARLRQACVMLQTILQGRAAARESGIVGRVAEDVLAARRR